MRCNSRKERRGRSLTFIGGRRSWSPFDLDSGILSLPLSVPAVRRKREENSPLPLPCLLLCISRDFLWLEEKAPGRRVDSPMYHTLPEKEGGGSRECQKRIYGLFHSPPSKGLCGDKVSTFSVCILRLLSISVHTLRAVDHICLLLARVEFLGISC